MNPEIEELEDILDQILKGLQEALQNGEQLSDAFQAQIAEEINWLTQTIDELYAQPRPEAQTQAPPPTPPPGPHEGPLTEAMPSSNVEGFAYDEKNGRLLIRFLGKYPNRNGPIYSYDGVPPNIFEIFRKGAVPAKTDGRNKWGEWWKGKYPSMGAAMYHVIRAGGYPYRRVA